MKGNKDLKINVAKEIRIFFVYFIAAILISLFGSVNKVFVDGAVYSRFFTGLFILNLFAWCIIYAIIRGSVILIGMFKGEK